jgi:predicted RNA-binding Zn-ribbon protein involved in translation (DUF1610 family)
MSNVGGPSGVWTRCTCSICFGHLEFDSEHVGETIQCPHCGMPTILFIPKVWLATPGPAVSASGSDQVVCNSCGTMVDRNAKACPKCGQVLRGTFSGTSADQRGSFIEWWPESAGLWLIVATLLIVVVGTPLYWLQNQYAQMPKPESEWQQKSRWQSEAALEMLKECTNVIVGLSRIIHQSVLDADDNPQQWSGAITAEYINHMGGIERTNVQFRFSTDTGTDGLMHVHSLFDSGTQAAKTARRSQGEY